MSVDLFIRRLQNRAPTPNVFNPWHQDDPLDLQIAGWPERVVRLRQHLDCVPSFVLVGEAPGYQGCRFSGLPFTSERQIANGRIPRVAKMSRLTKRENTWSEPSATIVWNTLFDLGIADKTVMWNAYPWHPHRSGEPYSNRRPTDAELGAGINVLSDLLGLFSDYDTTVVAVGRVAENLLTNVGITCEAIRHPANGGATKFREGLSRLVLEAA